MKFEQILESVLTESRPMKLTPPMISELRNQQGSAIVVARPYDFLKLTTSNPNEIINHAEDLEMYQQWSEEGKIDAMPWIIVDVDTNRVIGHEGRHRAAAHFNKRLTGFGFGMIFKKSGKTVKVELDDIPDVLVNQFTGREVAIGIKGKRAI